MTLHAIFICSYDLFSASNKQHLRTLLGSYISYTKYHPVLILHAYTLHTKCSYFLRRTCAAIDLLQFTSLPAPLLACRPSFPGSTVVRTGRWPLARLNPRSFPITPARSMLLARTCQNHRPERPLSHDPAKFSLLFVRTDPVQFALATHARYNFFFLLFSIRRL